MRDQCHLFSAFFIGDPNAGKSALFNRALNEVDLAASNQAIRQSDGQHLRSYLVRGETVKFSFVEVACGPEDRLRQRFPAGIIIVVVDLSKHEALSSASYWISYLAHCTSAAKHVTALVGTKSDISSSSINSAKLQQLAIANALPFFQVSAVTGQNVQTTFQALAQLILCKREPSLAAQEEPVEQARPASWFGSLRLDKMFGAFSFFWPPAMMVNEALSQPVPGILMESSKPDCTATEHQETNDTTTNSDQACEPEQAFAATRALLATPYSDYSEIPPLYPDLTDEFYVSNMQAVSERLQAPSWRSPFFAQPSAPPLTAEAADDSTVCYPDL